jgi:hypothetical protein
MGEQDFDQQFDEKTSQAFMKALLEDLRALEYMIATDGFETGWRESAPNRKCSSLIGTCGLHRFLWKFWITLRTRA